MPSEINEFISSKANAQVKEYKSDIMEIASLYDNMIESSKKATDQRKKENTTLKEVDEQTKQYESQLRQLNTVNAKLTVSESKLSKELERQKQELSKVQKETKAQIALEKAEQGSINQLKAANKQLRAERNALNITTEEGREKLEELNNAIDENDKLIKESTDSYTQAKINVGNYQESIEEAAKAQDLFKGSSGDIITNFINISQQEGGIKAFFQSVVGGLKAATKAGLTFIMTPIGAVIAAIVAGIALLSATFSRSQGFMDKFNEVMGGLSAILDNVVGRIFKLVGAVAKLGFSVITGDVEGMKDAIGEAGDAFEGLGSSIAEAYREGAAIEKLRQEVRKLTIETTTSLEKLRQESDQLQIIADDATRSFAEREDAAEKARQKNLELFETEAELARKREEIIVRENKLAKQNGELTDELRQKEADATAERIAAEGDLLKVQLENEKTRRELMQDRLERDLDILIDGFDNVKTINERIISDDKRTFEERKKILADTQKLAEDSYNEQIETIKKFTDVQFNENELIAEQDARLLNEKIRNLGLSEIIEGRLLEIIKERRLATADLAELEADIRSKQLDEARKTQEQISNSILEEEEKLSEEMNELEEADLEAEFERMDREEEKKKEQEELDAERRQREEEQAAINRQNLSTLFGKQSAASKALALKQAIVDGKAGVQAAFAQTPGPLPIKIAAAAVAGGIAAKNIQSILTTDASIPAFAEGTDSTPSGAWIAGEAGREIEIDKRGRVSMIDKPTLFTDRIGSTILSNPVTEKIMQESGRPHSNNINLDEVVKAIENNTPIMGINKFGIITISKKNKALTKHINDRYRN